MIFENPSAEAAVDAASQGVIPPRPSIPPGDHRPRDYRPVVIFLKKIENSSCCEEIRNFA